jgi:hypothetical protein
MNDRGVRIPTGTGNFFFTTASRPALGPTQPPIQWVPGAPLGVKRQEREADHSPPSSSQVENAWGYTYTPQYAFMGWRSVQNSSSSSSSSSWDVILFHSFCKFNFNIILPSPYHTSKGWKGCPDHNNARRVPPVRYLVQFSGVEMSTWGQLHFKHLQFTFFQWSKRPFHTQMHSNTAPTKPHKRRQEF